MQLNFKQFGEGEPIIILHGLFGMLDNWQTIGKKLAENYSVFLLDLRNHGRSPHSDDFTVSLMAEDVKQFMEDHWLYNATVIGHSMGGKVAMHLATQYDTLVENLIVVDIAPKKYEAGHHTIFDALLNLPLDQLSSRKEIEKHLALTIDDAGVRLFLMKNISRVKSGGFKYKMNLSVIHKNYSEILEPISEDYEFDHPTLFVRGQKSMYILEKDLELIHEIFPQSKLKTIEGAGHWIHADKPSAFLKEVALFLNHDPSN